MSQPKFCAKCGNPLGENEKFCGKCGAPAEQAQPQSAIPQPVSPQQTNAIPPQPSNPSGAIPPQQAAPSNGTAAKAKVKINKTALIAALIVLAAIIVVIVIVVNLTKYQKIDAQKLFRINFNGLDGKGTVTATLNASPSVLMSELDSDDLSDELYDLIYSGDDDDDDYSDYFADDKKTLLKAYDKAKNKSEAKDMRDALLATKKGEFKIKLDFSKDKDLKNGDKVTCTVDYDADDLKEEGIKLTNTEFEVTVKGLREAEEIDLFDGFELKFDGIDGRGEASYSSTSDKYPFVNYYIDNSYGLSNGDTVKMTAYVDSFLVDDIGMIDEKDEESGRYFTYDDKTYLVNDPDLTVEKEYKVEGLKEPEKIDIFEGIVFETRGADPYIIISDINTDGCSEVVQDNVNFYIDYDSSNYKEAYKVGDPVPVYAYVSSYMEEEGYKPDTDPDADGYYRKEIVLEGDFPKYYTDTVTEDDIAKLDDMFKPFLDEYKEDAVGSYSIAGSYVGEEIIGVGDFKLLNTYIALKDGFSAGELSSYDDKVCIYRLYSVSLKLDSDDKPKATAYFAIKVTDPYIGTDGTAYCNEYVSAIGGESKKDVVDEIKEYYDKNIKELKAAAAPTEDSSETSSETESSAAETDSSAADSSAADSSASDSSSKADSDSSEIVP